MKDNLPKRFSKAEIITLLVIALIGMATIGYAVTTPPYTFTAGTTAKASEVNANFQTLANAIDSIPNRPTRIVRQGQCTDLAMRFHLPDGQILSGTIITAPEVVLSDPPLVQAWLIYNGGSSLSIPPEAGIGIQSLVAEGQVILQGSQCPAGYSFTVVTVK